VAVCVAVVCGCVCVAVWSVHVRGGVCGYVCALHALRAGQVLLLHGAVAQLECTCFGIGLHTPVTLHHWRGLLLALQVKPALVASGKEPVASTNLLAKLGGAWRSKSTGMGKSTAKKPGVSMDSARVSVEISFTFTRRQPPVHACKGLATAHMHGRLCATSCT
jgi:hypothetical protein